MPEIHGQSARIPVDRAGERRRALFRVSSDRAMRYCISAPDTRLPIKSQPRRTRFGLLPATCFLGYLFWICAFTPAISATERELTVVVVNAHDDPIQPVSGARVSLSFVAASDKVVDARDATNRAGKVLLMVSPDAVDRDNLRIEVTGSGDLVIYEPPGGQLPGLPSSMTVKLLPKGSPALMGPPQLNALWLRLSLQNKRLEQLNRDLKGQLAVSQEQKAGLAAAIEQWAAANGLKLGDVETQVRSWAEDIERRKEQVNDEQRGLAELALKRYGAAAQTFQQSFNARRQAMKENEEKQLMEKRKDLRDSMFAAAQAANSYQLNSQYHSATEILEEASEQASDVRSQYKDDLALRGIWLDALQRLADAKAEEGAAGEAVDSSSLLRESFADYRQLIQGYQLPQEQEAWARTQSNLAYALSYAGERSTGTESVEYLAQAIEASKAALTVQTRTTLPQDWARTQNNLGYALIDQGERDTGAQTTKLLADAVQALRAALEVRTKADFPQDWAKTETILALALWRQSERADTAEAMKLLTQSIAAYRAALEVETRTSMPSDWAITQNYMGLSLTDLAALSSGPEEKKLWSEGVDAYHAALEVRTKTDLPQRWAMTQNNLGWALRTQGERSIGAEATDLLTQSVQAYRGALDVFTRDSLPQDWAKAQSNLCLALRALGTWQNGAQATDLFAQAAQACRSALEVRTRADLPQNFATTEWFLCGALTDESQGRSGAEAKDLLGQAVEACHAALGVFTRTDQTQDWAGAEIELGKALADQGDQPGASKALDSCVEAVPADFNVLKGAASVYENDVYGYDRAYELASRRLKLDASPDSQLHAEEAELTTSRFEQCGKQGAVVEDGSIPEPAAPLLLIRDSMKLACLWGAGAMAPALETEMTLLAKAAGIQRTDWNFAGTLHYLSSSPTFKPGRESWIALFQSLEKADSATMKSALKELEAVMKN